MEAEGLSASTWRYMFWATTNAVYLGSQTQKGIASYSLSANAQRPLAGAFNAAIFNTWRRFSNQVLYFAPPLIVGYLAMQWAVERELRNSNYTWHICVLLWLKIQAKGCLMAGDFAEEARLGAVKL
ncbi:hypothetical protein B2J93_3170 [Marssonina coronariae]|uniref:Cytochrome b-c1 complex subunit 8 n=1 Tax=Diplocarpon coronariae TaxID=2795749 RepID=A0A218Z3P5_9HELO|nr:hypothetical protein B2J93_3170 [Marssonina coronariae]